MIKIICIETRGIGAKLVVIYQRLLRMPHYQYGHTGVAVKTSLGTFVFEMTATGNTIRPIERFKGCLMADLGAIDKKIDKNIYQIFQTHIPYGFLDLLKIGYLMILRKYKIGKCEHFYDDLDDIVCSNLPRRVLAAAGLDVSKIPQLISPSELAAAMGVKKEFVFRKEDDLWD